MGAWDGVGGFQTLSLVQTRLAGCAWAARLETVVKTGATQLNLQPCISKPFETAVCHLFVVKTHKVRKARV